MAVNHSVIVKHEVNLKSIPQDLRNVSDTQEKNFVAIHFIDQYAKRENLLNKLFI